MSHLSYRHFKFYKPYAKGILTDFYAVLAGFRKINRSFLYFLKKMI